MKTDIHPLMYHSAPGILLLALTITLAGCGGSSGSNGNGAAAPPPVAAEPPTPNEDDGENQEEPSQDTPPDQGEADDPGNDNEQTAYAPIIFVHGYGGNLFGGMLSWATLQESFIDDGYPQDKLYEFSYNSLTASNTTSAAQLATFVDLVREQHPDATPHLIAHSNGGLVSRWYRVVLEGEALTNRFFAIGSPHQGTNFAYLCLSPACFEMRPGSSFLGELAGQGCDVSLWSATDGIILPAESARCGTSLQTGDIDHVSLLAAPEIYPLIRDLL